MLSHPISRQSETEIKTYLIMILQQCYIYFRYFYAAKIQHYF
nr:MAG TPA: hypothetical protein [Caudoviricetes sp.]